MYEFMRFISLCLAPLMHLVTYVLTIHVYISASHSYHNSAFYFFSYSDLGLTTGPQPTDVLQRISDSCRSRCPLPSCVELYILPRKLTHTHF